jgi:hypothetical protein
MADLALITVFFSMIFFPCGIAMRSVRMRQSGMNGDSASNKKVRAIDEVESSPETTYTRLEPRHDRRALALQRSRDLYYRERAKRSSMTVSPKFQQVATARPKLVDKKVG